jgi:hypothetical protein
MWRHTLAVAGLMAASSVQCGTICGTGRGSIFTTRGMREEVFTVLQLALQAANKHYVEALLRAAGSPDFQELPSAGLVQYLEVRSIRTRVFIYS